MYSRDFLHSYNPLYGNCYTFNHGLPEDSNDTRKTLLTGPLGGLSLTLWLQTHDYLSWITPSTGLRVVIHRPGTLPFPADEGIDITGGMETSIGITQEVTKRLSEPHGNCTAHDDERIKYFRLKRSRYTLKLCLVDCITDEMLETCGCIHPFYSWESTNPNDTCIDYIECTSAILYDFDHAACNCAPHCEDVNYAIQMSQAEWPSLIRMDRFMFDMLTNTKSGDLKVRYTDQFKSTEYETAEEMLDVLATRSDFAKINVFYTDLHFKTIETLPGYEFGSLLADMGGQLGLWVGFSLLTVLEFAELFAVFVQYFFQKCRENKKQCKVEEVVTLPEEESADFRSRLYSGYKDDGVVSMRVRSAAVVPSI